MATQNAIMDGNLVRMCLEAASESVDAVEKWRRQKRTLERLPSHLADALLRRLLHRRLLSSSLLEVFKESAEEVDLRGQSCVDAEWMAYIGAFRHLRSLTLADCHKLTNSALWPIAGMSSLKELDLSRCLKVNDAGIKHVISVSNLEKLRISETGVSANGVKLLSSLNSLTLLDLGGLPVTDLALTSLQVLTKLQHLDLWGSKITDRGVYVFQMLPELSFLNLAWTNVRKLPNLRSLGSLNMSNCTIQGVLESDGGKAPLVKFIISGASFVDVSDTLLHVHSGFLSHLDLSNSSLREFGFLSHLKVLERLDLSSTSMHDDEVFEIASIGASLRHLNLNKTKLSSLGVGILASNCPKLETLSLSGTLVDDSAIISIGLMSSLKEIDLSKTSIKGFIYDISPEADPIPSFQALQNLKGLRKLNLDQTQVMDPAVEWVSSLDELTCLSLGNVSLTDISFSHLSALSKLQELTIHDAVLTNQGLGAFQIPGMLRTIDLKGCWLLTEDDLMSFGKSHSKVEVRHERAHVIPTEQARFNTLSPTKPPLKKTGLTVSPCFIDQRLKYSRHELLGLRDSPLSVGSPCSFDSVKPETSLN